MVAVCSDASMKRRRSALAAKRFFRKLLKGLRMVPSVIVTDRLASYAAAKAAVMPTVAHLRGWRQNNRIENSHQPVQQRERGLQRFKSLRHAARFCSVFSSGPWWSRAYSTPPPDGAIDLTTPLNF
jgi:putative transposase